MNRDGLYIRKIEQKDNAEMASIIRQVLPECGAPTEGTAYADPELDRMYETYEKPGCTYWVIDDGERIWGGGGIAPLQGGPQGVCELQKMYFKSELRGCGQGKALLQRALEAAREMGYHRCYLETMPYMERAIGLYSQFGFRDLEGPYGDTGHTACQVWMEREL